MHMTRRLKSALFLLVSKHGFTDILSNDRIVLDPSRIAAQSVSEIGFIGGGIILCGGMRCGIADSGTVHGGRKLADHLRVSSGSAEAGQMSRRNKSRRI